MSRVTVPGYSIDFSDAARVARRRVRGLGGVVPIDFSPEEGKENELVKWYHERPNRLIRAMQLRREREGPYYHQYIVFELQGNGGLYRIDRRLRPNEDAPLNSLNDEGIPAFDTIEPVVSWDDPLFGASDCLISVEFKRDVALVLIMEICRRIRSHPLTKVYTLQRYNCYFFAQTLLLCVACGASDWWGSGHHSSPVPQQKNGTNITQLAEHMAKLSARDNFIPPNTSSRLNLDAFGYSFAMNRTLLLGFTYDWSFLTDVIQKNLGSASQGETQIQVYKMIQDLKTSAEKHWNNELNSILKWIVPRTRRRVTLTSLWTITLQPSHAKDSDLDTIAVVSLSRWQAFLDTWLSKGQEPCFSEPEYDIHDIAVTYLRSQSALWRPGGGPLELRNKLVDSIGREYDKIWEIALWEVTRSLKPIEQAVQIRLKSFEQNMVIRIACKEMEDRYQETEYQNHNLGNFPRYTIPPRMPFWKRKKNKGEVDPDTLMESTISEMQQFLTGLIEAHSVRVEEYKWLTKTNTTQVVHDIRKAMDEVWITLIQ